MKRLTLIVLALLARGGVAHAGDEVAAARALIAEQSAAMVGLSTSDTAALADTFTADAFAFLPSRAGAMAGRDEIAAELALAYSDAHDVVDQVTAKKVKIGSLGGDAAWLTAELTIEILMYGDPDTDPIHAAPSFLRVTELVVRDGKRWRARAAHVSYDVPDRDARALVLDGTASPLAAVPGAAEDAERAALLTSPTRLAAALTADKATAVLGSAGKDVAIGAAKGKKLLKRWAKLRFAVVGGVRWTAGDGWAYAAANVELQPAKAKTKAKQKVADPAIPYRLLVLFRPGADGAWKVVSVHYSLGLQ